MRKCQNEGKKVTVKEVLNPVAFDNIVRLNEGYRVLRVTCLLGKCKEQRVCNDKTTRKASMVLFVFCSRN